MTCPLMFLVLKEEMIDCDVSILSGGIQALTFQSSLRETYSQIRRRHLRAFNGTGVSFKLMGDYKYLRTSGPLSSSVPSSLPPTVTGHTHHIPFHLSSNTR